MDHLHLIYLVSGCKVSTEDLGCLVVLGRVLGLGLKGRDPDKVDREVISLRLAGIRFR